MGGKALGILLDTKQLETRNAWDRYSLIYSALCDVLQLPVVSGWVIEVIVGHCTYFALVNRDLLAVYFATYSFIRKKKTMMCPRSFGIQFGKS